MGRADMAVPELEVSGMKRLDGCIGCCEAFAQSAHEDETVFCDMMKHYTDQEYDEILNERLASGASTNEFVTKDYRRYCSSDVT